MPLQPLAAVLRAAQEGDPGLGVPPDLRADDRPWRPLGEDLVAEEVGRTARRWDAPPHVAAALWWKGYSYWATMPVALGWALNRRVPLMTYADTVVRVEGDDLMLALREPKAAVLADAPCAGDAGAMAVADEQALLETIRTTVLREHFGPLIGMLNDRTRVGERTLWGSVAEALTHPLAAYGEQFTGEPAAEWRRRALELLTALGPPVAGLVVPVPGRQALRRRTCCLWVALPDATACPSCCINRAP